MTMYNIYTDHETIWIETYNKYGKVVDSKCFYKECVIEETLIASSIGCDELELFIDKLLPGVLESY